MKNVSIEIKVEILKIFVGCSKSRSGSWTDIRKFLKYYLDEMKKLTLGTQKGIAPFRLSAERINMGEAH